MTNTVRIQKWNDGEIVKTTKGEYQFIKKDYTSIKYPTIAALVKDESNNSSNRSTANTKGKKGKPKAKKSADKILAKDEK